MKRFFLLMAVLLTGVTLTMAQAGMYDRQFGENGTGLVHTGILLDERGDVAVQSDGKILVAGTMATGSGEQDFCIVRFNADGSPDRNFGGTGFIFIDLVKTNDAAHSIAVLPDGKILVAGYSQDLNMHSDFAIARLTPTGELDETFGLGGHITTDIDDLGDEVNDMLVQDDGKILLAGSTRSGQFALARYNSNGTPDTLFGINEIMTTSPTGNDHCFAVTEQHNGKIIAAGTSKRSNKDFTIARFNASGSLDVTFGTEGVMSDAAADYDNEIFAVATLPDGKIIAAGRASGDLHQYEKLILARYLPDGNTDSTFGTDGKTTVKLSSNITDLDMLIYENEKIIISAGDHLLRFNEDGSIDTHFGQQGTATTGFQIFGIAFSADGKNIIAAGTDKGDCYTAAFTNVPKFTDHIVVFISFILLIAGVFVLMWYLIMRIEPGTTRQIY